MFVELLTGFTKKIKELGPLGKTGGTAQEIKKSLQAAKSTVTNIKVRTRFARVAQQLREINDYSPTLIESKIGEKLEDMITQEIDKHKKQGVS